MVSYLARWNPVGDGFTMVSGGLRDTANDDVLVDETVTENIGLLVDDFKPIKGHS